MKKSLIAIVTVLLVGAGMAKRAVSAKNGRAQTPAAPQTEQRESGRARSPSAPQTGNLSKLRRDELVGKIGEIKSFLEKSSDTNAVRLLRFAAEVEREVSEKKFGLVFEEHRENVDVMLEENLPVLTEVKKKFIGGDSLTQRRRDAESGVGVGHAEPVDEMVGRDDPIVPPLNFLIEGDNLAALKLLEKTHHGKIDLIYIDPPYNTGNKDFIYNDSYVDKTDTFRHSKWLSFMKKRLEIARGLMSDKGVIFISIDDNEYATLKILCDSIFMEENVETMIWHKVDNDSGRLKVTHRFRREHEYIIVAYKNKECTRFSKFLKQRNYKNKYTNPDNDPRGPYKQGIISDTEEKSAKGSENYYAVTTPSGKVYTRRWRFPKKEFEALDADSRIYYGKKGDSVPSLKVFINEPGLATPISILEELGTAKTAGLELREVFGREAEFLYPKPVSLIQHLIQISSNAGTSIILDFFAGSGTTGHAVMKLNAEDGGKRKFILVTNNENGICEKVTYERLKRVIERDKYAASLKYFKVDYIPIGGKVYYDYADELLKHIRELVELENAIDFRTDSTIAIAVTDKEFEKFVANDKNMEGKRALYVGHDVLIGKSARQKLERRGIEIRIIPQYYYSEQEA